MSDSLMLVADESVNKEIERLNSILNKFGTDITAALKNESARIGKTAQAEANRQIPKHYELTSSKVRSNMSFNQAGIKASGDTVMVSFRFAGNVIPIVDYNTVLSPGEKVSVHAAVKKGGAKPIAHAFPTQLKSGHAGVFYRTSKSRLPIKQVYGPAAPSLVGNPEVLEQVEQKALEALMKRMDHQLSRMLSKG